MYIGVSSGWLVTTNRIQNGAVTWPKLAPGIGKEGETLVVAASNSNNANRADYACTGTADDVIINQALNALPAAGGSVILMEGNYNITNSIVIPKATVTLTGVGNGTLIQTSSDITMINVTGFNEIIITKLKLTGSTTTNNLGILFSNTTSSRIVDCYINLTGNYAIRNVTGAENYFQNNHIYNSKSDCIRIDSGADNIISSNWISSPDSTNLIYLASTDNTVTGNHIFDGTYGIYVDADYNNITGNSISNTVNLPGTGTTGIYLNKEHCSVAGNTCLSCNQGVYINTTAHNNNITGNFLFGNYGVYLLGDDNVICGNTCNLNSASGIYTNGAKYCTITGNMFNSNFVYGIHMENYTLYNTIAGNICENNVSYGICGDLCAVNAITGNNGTIYLTRSSNNCISGNVCHDCGSDGIHLDTNSDQNIIVGNRSYSNTGYGVNINAATCNDNMIAKNHLIGNTAGGINNSGTNTDINGNLVASGVVAGSSHPITENYSGSGCTGADGALNRTLTLGNTVLSSNEQVTLDGLVLRATTHYTIAHNAAASVITFLVAVFDTQNITVRYYT
jgi:parallel beta-helix repeat protein